MIKKFISVILTLAIVVSSVNLIGTKQVKAAPSGDIAYGKSVISSGAKGTNPAGCAVDGNSNTKWVSANNNENQWISVDLGAYYNVSVVVLKWGEEYPSSYKVSYVAEGTSGYQVFDTVTDNTSPITKTHSLNKRTRFIKVECNVRGTDGGFSLYDFGVMGTLAQGETDPSVSVIGKKPLNITGGISAMATNSDINYPVSNLVDGSYNTMWWSGQGDTAKIIIDLGDWYVVNTMRIHWGADYSRNFTVKYSKDAKNWITYRTFSASSSQEISFCGLGDKVMRFVEITANNNVVPNGYGIYEIAFMGY